jgi:hypothetical protein
LAQIFLSRTKKWRSNLTCRPWPKTRPRLLPKTWRYSTTTFNALSKISKWDHVRHCTLCKYCYTNTKGICPSIVNYSYYF